MRRIYYIHYLGLYGAQYTPLHLIDWYVHDDFGNLIHISNLNPFTLSN